LPPIVRHTVALCLVIASCVVSANAAGHAHKAQGSERRAILDSLRAPVARRLGQPVIFHVNSLKVSQGWAYVRGAAHRADDTPFGPDHVWGVVEALLHKQGSHWKVMAWGQATDVSIDEKAKSRYPQAPREIFKSND